MQEQENEKSFNFLENLFQHMKRFMERIIPGSLEKSEEVIVSMGRSDIEKDQLREMCEENRVVRQRLKELRNARKKGVDVDHGEWLEQTVDRELTAVYPEISEQEKDEVKGFLENSFYEDIEANADALDEELEQTVEEMEGGNK